MTLLVLVVAITVHEFAHAAAADRLGDPTPRDQGRVTLNPASHLDPMGTLMMALSTFFGFGIGWGRPVLTHPANFRHPRRDTLLVAVWGPVSNLAQAVVYAGVSRFSAHLGWLAAGSPGDELIQTGVWVNLALAFFNLIPIPPLDGSKVLSALLPLGPAQAFDRFMAQWGLLLFLALIITHAASRLIGPPVQAAYSFLVG